MVGRHCCGFTLIEVLVASVILLLGATGFVTLQARLFQQENILEARQHASALARQKLLDIENYVNGSSNASAHFALLDSNVGGELASGEVDVDLDNGKGTVTFEREWVVDEWFFVDTDADTDTSPDTWMSQSQITWPITVSNPTMKAVTVLVSWTDSHGATQVEKAEHYISPLTTSLSALALMPYQSGVVSVPFTAPQTQSMIAFDVGDGTDHVSALPEISVGTDAAVTIVATRRYSDNGETKITAHEDFLTLACTCELAGSGMGYTPATTRIKDDELTTALGTLVNKDIGHSVDSTQHPLCESCCRDHHDTVTMINDEQFYHIEQGAPHKHYKRLSDGSYHEALWAGDPYDEACRFKRVDGVYVLTSDWSLTALTVLPLSMLADAQVLQSYREFVVDILLSDVQNDSLPAPIAGRDVAVTTNEEQLVARGVYVDVMNASDRQAVAQKIQQGANDWQSLVPFYEVDLTLMANWESQNSSIVTVSNSTRVSTERSAAFSTVEKYYDSYSRGLLVPLASGTTSVVAEMLNSNAGILGEQAIGPSSRQILIQDTVAVSVQ